MKKLLMMIPVLAAAFMIHAAPALSDEGTMGTMRGEDSIGIQKNECLLVAMNCADQQDTYQDRISKLQNEINKGTAVYTNEELKQLNNKLEDARENMEILLVN